MRAQSRTVPVLVAGEDEVAVGIRVQHHPADSDPVEEGALRKGEVFLPPGLHRAADQVSKGQGIAVAVAAHGSWRKTQPARDGVPEDVQGAGVDVVVVRIGGGDPVGPLRCLLHHFVEREVEAAGHAEQVLHPDLAARVARRLPFGHRRRPGHLQPPLLDQAARQGAGEALAHGPALQQGVLADPGRIALGDEAALVDHRQRRGPRRRFEGEFDRRSAASPHRPREGGVPPAGGLPWARLAYRPGAERSAPERDRRRCRHVPGDERCTPDRRRIRRCADSHPAGSREPASGRSR